MDFQNQVNKFYKPFLKGFHTMNLKEIIKRINDLNEMETIYKLVNNSEKLKKVQKENIQLKQTRDYFVKIKADENEDEWNIINSMMVKT